MRPKKRILLIGADAEQLSVRRYILATHGYAVFATSAAGEALSVCCDFIPEVILLCIPFPETERLLRELRLVAPQTSVIAISQDRVPPFLAGVITLSGYFSTADLLERVRISTQRKRGPKKKVASVRPETAEAMLA